MPVNDSSNHRTVEFGPRGLSIDGSQTALIGAEFHFWREQATFWPRTLDAIKQAGIDLVSTFVCWDFHELEEGSFDFTGRTAPERDLVGFLELCAQKDVGVILRPGPIIDAEWETRGPAPDVCTLERNDPRFLERARGYLAAVGAAAAPYQATRGGPIVLVAVDNEIYFPYASDYSWHEEDGDVFVPYSRQFAEAAYRDWLSDEFETVDRLNEAFGGTAYGSFVDVGPPAYATATPAEIQTSFRFVDEYCASYLDTLAETLRESGIDVPFYTNQKQFLAYLDWRCVGRSLDSVGLNLCMPNLVPGRQALTMSWFIRLQRMRAEFPWSPEYQAGWIGFDEKYGVISPEHGLYMGLLGAALGLRGVSFFMFVERDDWNWSPLNSFGKIRPTRFAAYGTLVSALRELEADVQLADVGLLWSLEEQRAHLAETSEGWEHLFKHWMELEEPKERSRWWRLFEELHATDEDFQLVDLAGDPETWPRVLVHAGSDALTDEQLERVRGGVAGGARLILSGQLPPTQVSALREAGTVDERVDGQLADALAAAGATRYVSAGPGLWSLAYRTPAGATTVFLVNPGAEARPARPEGSVTAANGGWRELVTGASGSGGLEEAVAELGPLVPPKTVWVIRLEGPDALRPGR
jgi:hypothetical protein